MPRATSPVGPTKPARRTLLAGALGVAGLAVTGCRIRLEDSAPEIPFIPTRDPIPAEPALLWLLQDCRALSRSDRAQDDLAPTALYEEQVAVLRTALYRAGIPIETLDAVPAEPLPEPAHTETHTETRTETHTPEAAPDQPSDLDGTTGPAPTQATEPPPSPSPTPAGNGAAAALRRLRDLAECGGGIFPLVMSLLAQRRAALTAGGVQVPDEAVQPDPARIWDLPILALPIAQLTDAARYGYQVVAAQTRDQTREVALEALWRIEALWREQDTRSGGRAATPAFGYPLPFPVNSEESAVQLATHVIDGLIDGYAGLLPGMVGTAQEETAVDLVTWLGSAAAIGVRWGVPLEAFPGTDTASTTP